MSVHYFSVMTFGAFACVLVYLLSVCFALGIAGEESPYDAVVEVATKAMAERLTETMGRCGFCSHFSYLSLVPGNPRGGLANEYV